jgi:argininosuccinate lyase
VIHALPLTYNKDLQEDKEHLFDVVDTIELTLAAATGMLAGVRFSRERMSAAASDELLAATDVADLLVSRCDVPFREAHGVVAGLVRTALDSDRTLSQLTPEELAAHSEQLASHSEQYFQALRQSSWLESKISEGGTATVRVKEQIEVARSVLAEKD